MCTAGLSTSVIVGLVAELRRASRAARSPRQGSCETQEPQSRAAGAPSFFDSFTPKLVSTVREGYGFSQFRADALAGLTVAIVALPLSMAIAIASGAKPENGLFAAIVGGFLISALGGSRFQIGGPAGAFIVLVAKTIETHGYPGLSRRDADGRGVLLVADRLSAARDLHQIHPLFGDDRLHGRRRADHLREPDQGSLGAQGRPRARGISPEARGLRPALGAASIPAIGLAAAVARLHPDPAASGSRAFRAFSRRSRSAASPIWAFDLPVETIGSKFGGMPRGLPAPRAARMSRLRQLAGARALGRSPSRLLGGIESLLSAVVADGMTGRRHRSNCELAAQGFANIGSALFGGLCVTGAIARTATNIRAGAHGPVAGMLHCAVPAGLHGCRGAAGALIPLATLAAVLTIVAWNMIEREQIVSIFKYDRGEAFVLATTFILTVFHDITVGIGAGVTLGSLLFMHRMAEIVEIETSGSARRAGRRRG